MIFFKLFCLLGFYLATASTASAAKNQNRTQTPSVDPFSHLSDKLKKLNPNAKSDTVKEGEVSPNPLHAPQKPSPSEKKDIPSQPSLKILAQAYAQKNDYKNHIRILRLQAQKEEGNTKAFFLLIQNLRRAYFKTFQAEYQEEALATINTLLEQEGKHNKEALYMEMFKLLSHKSEMEKNKSVLLELIQKMVRIFGEKKPYKKYLCKYFHLNEYHRESLKVCGEFIKSYPQEASGYVYYALSLRNQKEVEEKLKIAAKKFPRSVLAQLKAGDFFATKEDFKSALPYFQTAVQIRPNWIDIQSRLAQALFYSGKIKESYTHFLKACLMDKSRMLWPFKQAKSILNQRSQFKTAEFFETGINQCFTGRLADSQKT